MVLGCVVGAVLLTSGLNREPRSGGGAAIVAAPSVEEDLTQRAEGDLSELFPAPPELGYGWIADEQAASQQITDGPGLVHPCAAGYASDAARVQVLRRSVRQNERDVPGGMAMTFELAQYTGPGAQQALQERVQALQGCSTWRTTFAGYPDTPVELALIAPPVGGSSAGAHLVATPATAVGRQAVEYTYLVAAQGDVLLSAVVGNGNGQGTDLDTFAAGYFQQARQKLAGQPAPSPERARTSSPAPDS
ncbi:MAG TPA: hypothetical protein VFR07_10390 [Mycobacteriales bacterium]|jgi:hypothetical protein|nr:hypothetical protein [Mycobacteriales bacterium]